MDLLTNSAVVDDAVRFIEEDSRMLNQSNVDNPATTARAKADDSTLNTGAKAKVDLPGFEKRLQVSAVLADQQQQSFSKD
jgi:hypothetical protein